jgi:ankyrin repeat protein
VINSSSNADGGGPRPYDDPNYQWNTRQAYINMSPDSSGNFHWIIWGDGLTSLMTSIDIKSLQSAINRGDDINAQDIFGRTALMLHSFFKTLSQNDLPVFQFLIENGADVNVKDNEGRTALFYAVWGPNVEGIKMLIDHGADVNIIDNKGYTPLDIARIRYTLPEVTNEMIKVLSDSDARNNSVVETKINDERMEFYRKSVGEAGWWPYDLYISYADR